MLRKIGRLFVIKNRFEAFVIIYALALGASARGVSYLNEYPSRRVYTWRDIHNYCFRKPCWCW